MRITLTYNLRQSEDQSEAELFDEDYVNQLVSSIEELQHHVVPIEVSGPPRNVVDDLIASRPDLIFNMAEGIGGKRRESYYPAIYELLGLPYTGGTPGLLHVGLDKRLAVKLLEIRGIRVPDGALLTPRESDVPDDLSYPQIIKPNYEGSSMGITQDSIVNSKEEAQKRVSGMIEEFPEGLIVEQYIQGRELTVPLLSAFEGYMLEIVEYRFEGKEHKIFDYETKAAGGEDESLKTICPPELTNEERREVLSLADRAFRVMKTPDFARADIRLSEEDGKPYLIEVNPLPGLRPISPLITGAKAKGLSYNEVIRLIIESAKSRYGIEID